MRSATMLMSSTVGDKCSDTTFKTGLIILLLHFCRCSLLLIASY